MATIFFACDDDGDDPGPVGPSISSISPTSGVVGDTLTINGSNFGTNPSVTIGNQTATIIGTASATSIQVQVPQLNPGAYDVVVTAGDESVTASTQFTVNEDSENEVPANDPARELALHMLDNMNVVVDPQLGGISRINDGGLDPIPVADEVTSNLAAYPDDTFFEEVTYKGAFDPSASETWMDGWTNLYRAGYLAGGGTNSAAYDPANTAIIVNLSQNIVGDRTLSADSVYRIDGYTFVEDGTLTIEPGSVIIAETEPTTGDPISALIITRTATIMADGTAEEPIIMTSENDNGSLTELSTGEWGGLVILGEASTYNEGATEVQIEGIPTSVPAMYGGNNDDDNSGVIRYVSIRYTGDEIAAGNELQGLTLGGVGRGTTIDYVESFASSDDGIEIFGGTVNLKHFVIAFAEDDSYDFDAGWKGNGQFLFAIQSDASDAIFEWDGAIPDAAPLYTDATLYNMTLIGGSAGAVQAILMRDNTAGVVANSIITDFGGKALQVEDLPDTDADSYGRFQNGEIEILNNIWNVGEQYTQINSGDSGIIQLTE